MDVQASDAAVAPRHGPDGRPVFFGDPAMDRFASVVLHLASELWVQTERVTTLRALLVQKGLLSDDEVEQAARAAIDDATRDAAAVEFVHRVLAPLREARDAGGPA